MPKKTKVKQKSKAKAKFTAEELRMAFERTAQTIAGDVFQVCEECGEEPVLPREAVYDYLSAYGGPKGNEIFKAILNNEIGEIELDEANVPNRWI